MESRFTLAWNAEELARALKVTVQDVKEYFTDGRRVSFIIERRLMWEHPGWTLAVSEGAGYDLRDPQGGFWEVQSITRGGVYFTPSSQVGSGRVFGEAAFLAKLDAVAGFILADIVEFPIISVFKVPTDHVKRWYKNRELNAAARISRAGFHARLAPQLTVD
jgi:hypothetical protein